MHWRSDYKTWREHRIWQENYQALHVGELKEHAQKLRTAQVLDLGAGMGGFAVALARDTGARVIASDFNPAYSEIARLRAQRYALDMPALTSAGEAMPFATEAFDIVASWDVLEHVQTPRALIAECARVLKPDGLFFLTAINRFAFHDPHYHLPFINFMPRAFAEWLIERWERSKNDSLFQDRQCLSEMHYFTYGALTRLAHEYGFHVMDLRAVRVDKATRSGKYGAFAQFAARMGLVSLAYWLYRSFGMGTFEVLLMKERKD